MYRHDLEMGILIMIFKDESLEWVKLERLDAELFTQDITKDLFRKIKEIRLNKQPYDVILSQSTYFNQKEWDAIKYYFSHDISVCNFDRYYNILISEFCKRKAIELGNDKITWEDYDKAINKYHKLTVATKLFNTKRDLQEYRDEVANILLGNYKLFYLGIPGLGDDTLGDIYEGAMIVVGGRTSTGKTWMMLQMAYSLAEQGHKVLYLSCEMSKTQLMNRIIKMNTGIDIKLKKELKDEDVKKYDKEIAFIENKIDLTIMETSKFSEKEVNDRIKECGAKVVVADHIQRFVLPNKESRAAGFSDIANNLKAMATENKLLMIAGSQMNRGGETGNLDSIKESGGITEAADICILLERLTAPTDGGTSYSIHIAKNRNGKTGEKGFKFRWDNCRFEIVGI